MSTNSFPTPSPPHGASYSTPPPGTSADAEKKPHKELRIRRRNRLITSCLECRRRKLKCDKKSPCSNCTRFSRPCVFIAPGLDPDAQAKLAEVKEKMGMLERTLEDDVARRALPRSRSDPSRIRAAAVRGDGRELDSDEEDEDDEPGDFETQYLSTEDAAYYEDDGDDDLVDLGIAMGRVRITERIGGLVRPRLSEELAQALSSLPPKSDKPPSDQNPDDWMTPSRDYIAPSSSFFFAPGVDKTPFMTYLPSRALVDKLLAHYWQAVHVVARAVHRPTFERHYEAFWRSINSGIEPRTSFQAVVFAALLSSITSMSEDKVMADFGVDRQSLVDNFRHGTESSLARANFLRTTKFETVQAFVMYLIPLCRAEVSRAHSALTGTCIRLAECMSLHRDPTAYSTSPVEIHVRRMIWHQLCFLDLRTCEATGPRPHIRIDDYDTQFPLNIDDIDLERAENGENVDVTSDRPYFTDMTITRMRFETYEMHRMVWHERSKMEKKATDKSGQKKVSALSILRRIQAFNAAMEKTYLPMLSKTTPLHVMAKEIHGILSNRLYIMILQKFASKGRSTMPERLRRILLSTCVMILDHSMTIEQQPALYPWAWYVGALHQYQVTILLMSEMYAGERDPALEVRIWRGLDFAFNLSPELDPLEKTRMILEELVSKTEVYSSIRRVRPTTNMARPELRHYGKERLSPRPSNPRERSGSLHSGGSSSGGFERSVSGGPSGKEPQVPTNWSGHPMGPTLPVPDVDWGNIDLGASASSQQHLMHPGESLAWQSFEPSGSSFHHSHSPSPMPSLSPGHSMPTSNADIMNLARTGEAGGEVGGVGAVGADAMNDVDWHEIEALFSGAETSTDNLLIPPFTFPQFSPSDLQWSPAEGL